VITADSKYFISASEDKSIIMWDLHKKVCLHSFLQAHTGKISEYLIQFFRVHFKSCDNLKELALECFLGWIYKVLGLGV